MTLRREAHVAGRMLAAIRSHSGPDRGGGVGEKGAVDEPIREGTTLTRRTAILLYEAALWPFDWMVSTACRVCPLTGERWS